MTNEELQNLVEEATADFATDDPQAALAKLARAKVAKLQEIGKLAAGLAFEPPAGSHTAKS